MKYAIFDMDGTLLDSMWIWDTVDEELLKSYGHKDTAGVREQTKTLSTKASVKLLKSLYDLAMSEEEMLMYIADFCRGKYAHEVVLKPYVAEYLEKLKQAGTRMCIATASVRESVLSAFTRLGILDYFEFLMTADDVKTGKENPEIFLLCAERFGAEPNDVVVFDDALHALKTAKSAGFKIVGVHDASSGDSAEEIRQLSDIYMHDFSELMDRSIFEEDAL